MSTEGRFGWLVLSGICLVAVALSGCRRSPSAQAYDYDIARYRAVFELMPNQQDLQTTLDITYRIGATPKVDGFKFIGSHEAENLSAEDDAGQPLPAKLVRMRENKLEWRFPASSRTTLRVVIHFLLHGACRQSARTTVVEIPWAGIFRVPVAEAVYELKLAGDRRPSSVRSVPRAWEMLPEDGGQRLRVQQKPLTETLFKVEFER